MSRRYIRLSIKISSFTMMMVVVSMMASFYVGGGRSGEENTAWVLIFSSISFVVALLYTLFLDRFITVPIQRLVDYTHTMVESDFRLAVPPPANDEIGRLAMAMDQLRRRFLAERSSLRELNEQLDAIVAERTRALETALENLRQTQQELIRVEKLASVGRLAGGLAHEINNPAGVILTRTGLLIELAREENLSEDMVEGLMVIDRQVSRISKITRDLLTFSRMAPLRREKVDLSSLLDWCWSLYAAHARELNVQLMGEIPPGIKVVGDTSGLEQVIGNLIKNALDAMDGREGTIERRLEVVGDQVRLTLLDNGPGIPEEVLPRIFDPFFTTKKVGKGTGLGLAISYGILQELEGSIEAANRPEGGACFTIFLPLASASGESVTITKRWVFDPGPEEESA